MKLAVDLTVKDGSYSKDIIIDNDVNVHPAFELIIDRGADYSNLNALNMIADNAWCAGVVLGPKLPDFAM